MQITKILKIRWLVSYELYQPWDSQVESVSSVTASERFRTVFGTHLQDRCLQDCGLSSLNVKVQQTKTNDFDANWIWTCLILGVLGPKTVPLCGTIMYKRRTIQFCQCTVVISKHIYSWNEPISYFWSDFVIYIIWRGITVDLLML